MHGSVLTNDNPLIIVIPDYLITFNIIMLWYILFSDVSCLIFINSSVINCYHSSVNSQGVHSPTILLVYAAFCPLCQQEHIPQSMLTYAISCLYY